MTADPRAVAAAKPLAKRIERYEKAVRLQDEGMTLDAIGQQFDPPIGREAVRQMIARGRPKAVGRPRKPE